MEDGRVHVSQLTSYISAIASTIGLASQVLDSEFLSVVKAVCTDLMIFGQNFANWARHCLEVYLMISPKLLRIITA